MSQIDAAAHADAVARSLVAKAEAHRIAAQQDAVRTLLCAEPEPECVSDVSEVSVSKTRVYVSLEEEYELTQRALAAAQETLPVKARRKKRGYPLSERTLGIINDRIRAR
eukprot:COSAG01_NODE_19666_length_996_cov_5.799331_1_plen_110_part_00